MKLGHLSIDGFAALAPMAGVTDRAFRELCASFGAAYVVTEMVSARGLLYHNRKTAELMELSEAERPAAIQLFGDDPQIMAQAARRAMDFSPDAIDINMGCPAPKVTGTGGGSALMKDPQLCARIVEAVKAAVPVPVTVKIRKGWDDEHVNAPLVAKLCAQAGADAITVHGRTREQMYRPSADWEIIRKVRQAVDVPVIGNGDVACAADAARMMEQTGCDLVMVGRAALGNPWIFREINAFLGSGRVIPPPGLPERLLVLRRHVAAMCALKGEAHAMREARKHAGWYLRGLKNAAQYRRRTGALATFDDLDHLIRDILAQNAP